MTVPSSAFPGPENITRVVLANGITILTRPNYESPSVVVSGYTCHGSLNDPESKLGLSHFTSLSLMRGTSHYQFQQIYDRLESIGASLGFGSGMHTSGFGGRALAEDLPVLLDMLREAMQEPVFPVEQIERLRAQLLTSLAIRDQDTGDMASLAFDEQLYAGHPYARPEDGYVNTVRAITREDIVDYHKRAFGPQGMVIVVVGAVTPENVVEQISSVLGSWNNPLQLPPPTIPELNSYEYKPPRLVTIPGKTQTDLVMGCLGPNRRSPDYMAASLGNNILGQFGMMGRIGDVVREQSGLAYYAYTSLNAGIGPGSWEVTAGINPSNLEKTIELVRSEIKRFVSEPVTAEELGDSQANYIGRLPLSLESNSGMAGALVNLERYNLGLDYYQKYPSLVQEITPQAILEVSRRYLDPERLIITAAGPDNSVE